jgi:hypothetical protein
MKRLGSLKGFVYIAHCSFHFTSSETGNMYPGNPMFQRILMCMCENIACFLQQMFPVPVFQPLQGFVKNYQHVMD